MPRKPAKKPTKRTAYKPPVVKQPDEPTPDVLGEDSPIGPGDVYRHYCDPVWFVVTMIVDDVAHVVKTRDRSTVTSAEVFHSGCDRINLTEMCARVDNGTYIFEENVASQWA